MFEQFNYQFSRTAENQKNLNISSDLVNNFCFNSKRTNKNFGVHI